MVGRINDWAINFQYFRGPTKNMLLLIKKIPTKSISITGPSGRFLPPFQPKFLYNSAFENDLSD